MIIFKTIKYSINTNTKKSVDNNIFQKYLLNTILIIYNDDEIFIKLIQ